MWRTLKGMWRYFAPDGLLLTLALGSLLGASVATLCAPLGVRYLVDGVLSVGGSEGGWEYALLLVGVGVFLAISSAARFGAVTMLGERATARLRMAAYESLLWRGPAGLGEVGGAGGGHSLLSGDASVVQTNFASTISVVLRNLALLGGSAGMLAWTSPRLSFWALLTAPFLVLPLVGLGALVKKLSRGAQEAQGEASAMAGEALGLLETTTAYGAQGYEAHRYEGALKGALGLAGRRAATRAVLTALVISAGFCGVAVAFYAGLRGVATGGMTPGLVGQFLLYALFMAASLGALADGWGEFQKTAGAAQRLLDAAELGSAKRGEGAMKREGGMKGGSEGGIKGGEEGRGVKEGGDIVFDDVHYQWRGREEEALRGLTFTAREGETTALAGASGAGKSTALRLLFRFYERDSGKVTLGGEDISEREEEWVRERLSGVFQEGAVYGTSLRENIAYGFEASDEEVEKAAREVGLHEFIMSLPEGYETRAGERGGLLSGGQRQRVALARALLRGGGWLVLDEATSALDGESERAVLEALERHVSLGGSALVAAHRSGMAARASKVVVLEEGRAAVEGTHEELLRSSGLYRRLTEGWAREEEALL